MARRTEAYRADRPIVPELAAGGVVLAPAEDRVLLLHLRAEDRWTFPKGHVDPGESLWVAARREIREESGLHPVRFGPEVREVTYRFYDPSRETNVHKTSVYFLVRAESTTLSLEPTFDAGEWREFAAAMHRVAYDAERDVLGAARARLTSPVDWV